MSFSTSSSRPAQVSVARSWAVLICLSILQFLIAVDVTVVNVALPSIGSDLGVDARGLTWVVIGYTITGGGLLMLGGRLGDVFGRRRLLLIGTAFFGAASLMAGLAETFPLLVGARLLQGAGEALALPAAMATIVLLFPEGRARARALSVWAAVASCGLVLGFVLSGLITEYLGWRWIFLIAVPFVLVVLIASAVLLPQDRSHARAPLDIIGSVLLTSAPLLFAFGVVEAGDSGGDVPWSAIAALVGAAAAQLDAPAWLLTPAMLFIAAGMGFGLVGLQYAAVTGVTDEDAGVASGVQRAADQLGGSAGVTVYVSLGFAPVLHGISPYVLSSGLALIGLCLAAIIVHRLTIPNEGTTEAVFSVST